LDKLVSQALEGEGGWQTGGLCSDLTGAYLMLNGCITTRQLLEVLPLFWVVF